MKPRRPSPLTTYTTYSAHRLLSSEECGWRVAGVVRRRRAVHTTKNSDKAKWTNGSHAADDDCRPWPLAGMVVGLGGHGIQQLGLGLTQAFATHIRNATRTTELE